MPRSSLILAAALALAGCATREQIVQSREQVLAAAGFQLQPATTTAQQEELARLPPHQVIWQQRDGKLTFLYADPLVCRCLFVGDEAAYQRFRRMEFALWVTQQNVAAAQMNAASWAPWGGPPIWMWR